MIASADREAIADLLTEFGYHADQRDARALCGLFLPQAKLHAGGAVARGSADLLADFERRFAGHRRTRHLWSNLALQPADDGQVAGRLIQMTYEQDGDGPVEVRVNDLTDVYGRDGEGRWRFLSRTIERQFRLHAPTT